jgi:hypothetical protein
MRNQQPIIFIHEDIVNESSMDSDATVELTTANTDNRFWSPPALSSINNDFLPSSDNNQVRTNIIRTRSIKETKIKPCAKWSNSSDRIRRWGIFVARFTSSTWNILPSYIKKRMSIPVPRGDDNFLNSRFDNDTTLLHGSVRLWKHDMTNYC